MINATTKAKHAHRTKTTQTRAYMGSNPTGQWSRKELAAQGGVTHHETCSCGATRIVNVNGSHRCAGPWTDADDIGTEV